MDERNALLVPDARAETVVAHWREMLCSALEYYGGFQWSLNHLFRVHGVFHDVLRQYVGITNPSPFKRCAAFAVAFMREKCHPVYGELDRHKFKSSVDGIDRYSGAVLAYEYVRFCLHGATIDKPHGTEVLENPILISEHTFVDIVHSLSLLRREEDAASFHLLELLFEQLAYCSNENGPYDRII